MSMMSHLEALERRHDSLSKEIEAEMRAHPSLDSVELQVLKRKKLQLKDEIARIKGEQTMH